MRAKADFPLDGRAAAAEISRLRKLLAEAQSTLRAIRNGEVDAVVVESPRGPRVYTLTSAEFDYRILVESMKEGALILTRGAAILYANAHFASMVERPLAQVMGCSLYDILSAADQASLRRLLRNPGICGSTADVLLQNPRGATMAARVSIRRMPRASMADNFAVVVSDLTQERKRESMLRSFAQALMRMQESERQQLATNLGDNVAQILCSILMRSKALANCLQDSDFDVRDDALEAFELLRRTADEVRSISTSLRPQGMQILGLASELRGLATEFADRLGILVHVDLPKSSPRLSPTADMALYRILQEALLNVEQHAHAHNVRVTLKRRGLAALLTIEDDGVGFDVRDGSAQALQAGCFGLVLMHERAAAVGGSLTVRSSASAGTQVRVSVPLSRESSASA